MRIDVPSEILAIVVERIILVYVTDDADTTTNLLDKIPGLVR